MSKKRRDSKNRVLRSGESQRKDGRYAYKYIDTFGNPQFVYAWKLVPTDKTPAGKREDISLRESSTESNDTAHLTSYVLYQHGKCRNEPESITVHYGTFQHYYDAELLRTRYFRQRKS